MRNTLLTFEQILSILAGTPLCIASLTAGLAQAQLHDAPNPGEWSLNDVLAHLRACNEVWGSYIKTIVAEDRPTWRGVSPRAWIKNTDYLEQDFQPALQSFTARRAELVAILEALPPEGWSRGATVIDMVGKPLERTVLSYADSLARHERSHIKQIERLVRALRV